MKPIVLYSKAQDPVDAALELGRQLATYDVDRAGCAALVFASGRHGDVAEELSPALTDVLGGIPFLGISAQSAFVGLHIDEESDALCAVILPDAAPTLRLADAEPLSAHVAATLLADAPEGRARFLAVSPALDDMGSFLASFEDGPDALGGLCNTVRGPFGTARAESAAGLLTLSSYRWVAAVSSAIAAVGDFHDVTKFEGAVLWELDGEPAADVLFRDLADAGVHPQQQNRALAVFYEAMDATSEEATPGSVVAIDPQTRALRLSHDLAPGTRFRFATVTPKSARADLETALHDLSTSLGPVRPTAVFVFSCAARSERLMGSPLYDVGRVADTFAENDVPVVGGSFAGEIATMGLTPELLSYSCVIGALIPETPLTDDSL